MSEIANAKRWIEEKIESCANEWDGWGDSYQCNCTSCQVDDTTIIDVKLYFRHRGPEAVAECKLIYVNDRVKSLVGDFQLINMIMTSFYGQMVNKKVKEMSV